MGGDSGKAPNILYFRNSVPIPESHRINVSHRHSPPCYALGVNCDASRVV